MSVFTLGAVLDPGLFRREIDAEFARIWQAIGSGGSGGGTQGPPGPPGPPGPQGPQGDPGAPPSIFLMQKGVGAATTFPIPDGHFIGQNTVYVASNLTPSPLNLNWGISPGGAEVASTSAAQGAPAFLNYVNPIVAAPDDSGNGFTLYVDGTWKGATADIYVEIVAFR